MNLSPSSQSWPGRGITQPRRRCFGKLFMVIRLAWQSVCVSRCRGPHGGFCLCLLGYKPDFLVVPALLSAVDMPAVYGHCSALRQCCEPCWLAPSSSISTSRHQISFSEGCDMSDIKTILSHVSLSRTFHWTVGQSFLSHLSRAKWASCLASA